MKSKSVIICFICTVLCALSAQAQELLNYPLDTVNGEEVYRYEVEKSIGLYRIGVNFNVTQADIIRLNPQLNERGLHYKEILLIPTGRKVEKAAKPAKPSKVEQDVVLMVETAAEPANEPAAEPAPEPAPEPALEPAPTPAQAIELALMLPFESQQTKRSANSERMMEFYQGALLALHDLQKEDTRYRLRVFDTERSERRVNSLCDSTVLDNVRAIIGPVYPIQIERVAAWAASHKVPVILPFSAEDDLDQKPYVMQFNSTDRQQADSLRVWIENHDVNCVVVEVKEADMSESSRMMRKQLQDYHIPYMSLPLRDLINDSASYALDPSKENLILLHSDKFQHVRILMPHIAKLQEDSMSVRIISQYSWIKENISIPQVYASMFTAETDRSAYDAQWSTYFSAEHVSDAPRYDLLGYDLMRAAVAWLQGEQDSSGLQSDIRWLQEGNGGWQNANVKVQSEK